MIIAGRPLKDGEVVIRSHRCEIEKRDRPQIDVDRDARRPRNENLNIVKGRAVGHGDMAGMNPAEVMANNQIKAR